MSQQTITVDLDPRSVSETSTFAMGHEAHSLMVALASI